MSNNKSSFILDWFNPALPFGNLTLRQSNLVSKNEALKRELVAILDRQQPLDDW